MFRFELPTLCFSLLILFPSAASAENAKDVQIQLASVRSRIEKEEQRLHEVSEQRELLEKSKTQSETQLNQVNTKVASLGTVLTRVRSEEQKISGQIELSKTAIKEGQQFYEQRLAALYKTSRHISALDYLFGADGSLDAMQRYSAVQRVAVQDERLLSHYTSTVKTLSDKQKKLREFNEREQQHEGELRQAAAELEKVRFEQAQLLQKLREQQGQKEKAVHELHLNAERLEKFIQQLTGSEEPAPTENKTVEAKTTPIAPTPTIIPYSGEGLTALKGALNLPVSGKLVQGFGKRKHTEFSDFVFSKGMEFNASSGSSVHAVAPGEVVYRDELPGYGKVVILDHGARYYTLYGRLSEALVQMGDKVKAGDSLAVLGAADKRGRNFYFELRLRGQAVDPAGYFRQRPGAQF